MAVAVDVVVVVVVVVVVRCMHLWGVGRSLSVSGGRHSIFQCVRSHVRAASTLAAHRALAQSLAQHSATEVISGRKLVLFA